MNFTLIYWTSLLFSGVLFSPSYSPIEHSFPGHYCATDQLLARQKQADPAFGARHESLDLSWQATALSGQRSNTLYLLPVVIHVVHEYGPENITDAQAEQAVAYLNQAFENSGYYDQDTGVDTEIEFCLAKRDPDGGPTSGITRTDSPLTEFFLETQDEDLKGLIQWDPTKYINIWVVKDICSISIGCGVAGYATFPASHGLPEDGIVIEADFFGNAPAETSVLSHEMGHYLGLYHTFQGGCPNDDCLANGDQVCDTPPDQSTVAVPCDVEINSCFSDVNAADPNNPFTDDQLDLFNNYMDYGGVDCYNMFTQGQADRMAFFIENVRSSLLDSDACQHPCPDNISVNVIPGDTIIQAGSTLSFTNLSMGATSFEWAIDGNLEATSADFSFTFNTEGDFEVTLTMENGNPDCTVTLSFLVRVVECYGNAHVDVIDGVDMPGCGDPLNRCATIQYALDNIVCPGDTVFIHSGTYTLDVAEPVLTPIASIPENYSVTFFGVEDNGPAVIDGNNQRRGFQYNYLGGTCPDSQPNDGIQSDLTFNFANLEMINCWVVAYFCGTTTFAQGGAVQIFSDPESTLNVSFHNCRFTDNFLDDPQFINNNGRSVGGAAIHINGRAANNAPDNEAFVLIDRCYFTNNQANQMDNGGHGGAVFIQNANEVTVRNSYFCENSVYSEMADNGDLSFDRNGGGALHFLDTYTGNNPHSYVVEQSYFVNNSATTADGAMLDNQSEGGAIFLHRGDGGTNTTNSTLTIGNSYFYNNFNELGIEHVDISSGTLDLNSIGNNVFEDDFFIEMANDTTICDSVLIGVQNPIPGAEYDWSNGETGATTQINESGTYSVTVTLGTCMTADTIEVTVVPCVEECDNGIDDDGDGLVDCCDPDLWDAPCCEDHPILNLGPDTTFICDNGVLELMADTGFVSYTWQDGWPEPTYTVYSQGTYWVTVEDSICGTLTDTITVLDDPETIARVMPEVESICPGESVTFSVDPIFDTYLWIPDDFLSCSDCPNPTSTPDEAVSYIFIGGFANGCYSVDTVFINIETLFSSEDIVVCEGASADIFGEQISTPGSYSETFTSVDGCDSTHTINLSNFAEPTINFDEEPACSNLDNGSLTAEVLGGTGPYSYAWSTPGVGDNPTADNIGVGTYSVTITDGNDCTYSASGTVTPRTTDVDVLSTNSGCEDECLGTITVVPNTNQDFSVSLTDGTPFDGLVLENVCFGVYDLVLTDQLDGCEYAESTLVTTFPEINVETASVVEVLQGDTVQLEVTVSTPTPVTYLWSPEAGLSCTDCPNPLASPEENTIYTLTLTDANGCTTEVEIRVNVSKNCEELDLKVPNIFSPGADGVNDTFGPLLGDEDLVILSFNVFNRFGQNVHSVEGQYIPWDGRQNGNPAPADVYAYILKVDCSGITVVFSGEVTLLR